MIKLQTSPTEIYWPHFLIIRRVIFVYPFEFFHQVHKKLPVYEDESDLSGRVKELGRIFEGGGPIFPKTAKNDSDAGIHLFVKQFSKSAG